MNIFTSKRTVREKSFKERDEKNSEKNLKQVNRQRRKFLDMVSKTGLSMPLLQSSSLVAGIMSNRFAQAQGMEKKRVIFCYLDSGGRINDWLPGSASNMNFVTEPYGPNGYNVAGICNFRGIDVETTGHANSTQAMGVPNYSDDTMDMRLANVLGGTSRFGYIYLGAETTQGGNPLLISRIGSCYDTPEDAYSRVFGGDIPPPMNGGQPDTTYLRAFEANHKALQRMKKELTQEEKQRLDVHGAALEKLEARVALAYGGGSQEQMQIDPQSCDPGAPNYANNFQAKCKAQADIAVAALQCDLTNVITLQLGNHQGTWRSHEGFFNEDYHQSLHGSTTEIANKMHRYFSDPAAYLLDRLMKTNDADGRPLIETTVFAQTTCMGNGQDHTSGNAPFILATKMPGFNNSFSAQKDTGNCRDFAGVIPRGMGLNNVTIDGNNDLGLI